MFCVKNSFFHIIPIVTKRDLVLLEFVFIEFTAR